jgi:hypothetical protein
VVAVYSDALNTSPAAVSLLLISDSAGNHDRLKTDPAETECEKRLGVDFSFNIGCFFVEVFKIKL